MQLYAERGDIENFAEQHGYGDLWASYDNHAQDRLLVKATLAIEAYHGKPRIDGTDTPWGISHLRFAAVHQTIYLARIQDSDEIAARINAITDGSYSDGVISVADAKMIPLDPTAKHLVDNILKQLSPIGSSEFGRG